VSDYLGRDDVLALDRTSEEADVVLALSAITGHGGEPVVEADRLADLLAQVREVDEE
jgi:hypothetical protein